MEPHSDRSILAEALLLLRQSLETNYKDDVSKQPRNGKSIATEKDEANEEWYNDKLRAVDALLQSCSKVEEVVAPPATHIPLPTEPPQDLPITTPAIPDTEEPYINPFTGKWVYPYHPEQAGPSGTSPKTPQRASSNSGSDHIKPEQESHPIPGITPVIEQDTPTSSNIRTPTSSPTTSETNGEQRGSLPEEQVGFDETLDQFEQYFEAQRLDGPLPQPVETPQLQNDSSTIFELDRLKALELANEIPQDYQQLRQTKESLDEKQRRELQAMQDDLYQRDRAEIDAAIAHARHLQDEWNREQDELLLQEQEMARRVAELEEQKENAEALKHIRRMQEQFQAHDNLLIDEDRRLAIQLAMEENPEQLQGIDLISPFPNQSQASLDPPPYFHSSETLNEIPATPNWQTTQNNQPKGGILRRLFKPKQNNHDQASAVSMNSGLSSTTSFTPQWPPQQPTYQIPAPANMNPMPALRTPAPVPAPRTPAPNRLQVPTHRRPAVSTPFAASDKNAVSDSLAQARRMQAQWEAEIQKNEAAARAAQAEINAIEDKARREFERTRQEFDRKRREEERRQQEAERQRLARMVECNVCGESADRDQMCRLPCNHAYCRVCLTQTIEHAVKSKKPFQCCRKRAPLNVMSKFLPAALQLSYGSLVEELDTPNPIYCSRRSCGAFIQPQYIKSDKALCPKCSTETCSHCKQTSHTGVCKQDSAGQALLSLGSKKQWKTCPHCGNMVERSEGCLHMTCRCGREFCYNCGKPSTQCNGSRCSRR